MALTAVEGIYRNGKVELMETPAEMEGAKVVVTFLSADPNAIEQQKQEREAARARMFARMRKGLDFGGEKFNRAEIYEDRMNELDARRD